MTVATESVLAVIYAFAAIGFGYLVVHIRHRNAVLEGRDAGSLPLPFVNPMLAARLRHVPGPSHTLPDRSNPRRPTSITAISPAPYAPTRPRPTSLTQPAGLAFVESTASALAGSKPPGHRAIRNKTALSYFFASATVSFTACLCRAVGLPLYYPMQTFVADPNASGFLKSAVLVLFDISSFLPAGWRLFSTLTMTSYWAFMLSVSPQLRYLRVPPAWLRKLGLVTAILFLTFGVCAVLIDYWYMFGALPEEEEGLFTTLSQLMFYLAVYAQLLANIIPLLLSVHLCACVATVYTRQRRGHRSSIVVWNLFGGQFKSFGVAAVATCANLVVACYFFISSSSISMYDPSQAWSWETFWYFLLEIAGGACACIALFFASVSAQKAALEAAAVNRVRHGWSADVGPDTSLGTTLTPIQPGSVTGFADGDDNIV
jgi:hypothetical protein